MAYWAELDKNNEVIRVVVSDTKQFLIDNLGGNWIETFYDAKARKNYAGVGYTYDNTLDAFIPPKPYNSWVLDETVCKFKPPKEMPKDGDYVWDESKIDWTLTEDKILIEEIR